MSTIYLYVVVLFYNIFVFDSLRHFSINSQRLSIFRKQKFKLRDVVTSMDLNSTKAATRIYKPKSVTIKVSSEYETLYPPRSNINSVFVLTSPHFVVRFRTPRIKSKLKLQLEELQVIFVAI